MPNRLPNLVGKSFSRLTAVSRFDGKYYQCVCDCGQERKIAGWKLLNGARTSCGECSKKLYRPCVDCGNEGLFKSSIFGVVLCSKHFKKRCSATQHRKNCVSCGAKVSRWDDTKCRQCLLKNAGQCLFCDRPISARGMCNTHYSRWRSNNIPYAKELARKYARKIRERDPLKVKREVENLSDWYLIYLLKCEYKYLKLREFPEKLLEVKRLQLKIKRGDLNEKC